jgi:hypothetical protein
MGQAQSIPQPIPQPIPESIKEIDQADRHGPGAGQTLDRSPMRLPRRFTRLRYSAVER